LLGEAVEELTADSGVVGILLTGSLARGDALPGTDVDLQVLLADGAPRTFRSETRRGVIVEWKASDFETARSLMEARPMEVYSYLDGRILHDPKGRLARLQEAAHLRFTAYRTPAEDRRAIAYSAKSSLLNLETAERAGDHLKAAYVATTVSWPILEGLRAANDTPVPPNSSVWPHLRDLPDDPSPLEDLLRLLFLGGVEERVTAASGLMRRIAERLESE
ncbi:MAG: nucleotidyltransferase domain-containing protein, partial [Rubrobacter sp.]